MSREWTKEPWYAHGPHIEDKHGNRVNLYDHNPSNRERAAVCVSACATLSDPTTSIPALLRVAEAARQILKASSDVNDAYISGAKPSGRLGSKIVNLAMDSEMLRHALSALPASDERGGA